MVLHARMFAIIRRSSFVWTGRGVWLVSTACAAGYTGCGCDVGRAAECWCVPCRDGMKDLLWLWCVLQESEDEVPW